MPLVDMQDMLGHAHRNGYAVPVFAAERLDHLAAAVAAAQAAGAPAILSLDGHRLPAGTLGPAAAAGEAAAATSPALLALHCDVGSDAGAVAAAINSGCNGVTLRATPAVAGETTPLRTVVEMAHGCGVAAGARLAAGDRRAAAEAARDGAGFLALDAAPSTGAAPGSDSRAPLPLVMPAADHLNAAQLQVQVEAGASAFEFHPFPAAGGPADALRAAAEDCIHRCGAAGRGADAGFHCRPRRGIQHVIVYNVEGADDRRVAAMMARGREVLARIPGVRRVVTGEAVTTGARYRFCWVVEFVHENVIAGYRDHPDHVAFANELFRPIAGNRITIDFAEVTGHEAGGRRPAGA